MAETTEQKIEQYEQTVKELEEKHAAAPSDDLKWRLARERDALNHLNNSLFGSPKYRAEEIAFYAREKALEKAVGSAPAEDEDED